MKSQELEQKVFARGEQIAPELAFQYDNLFHVLGVTIRRLSRQQWASGGRPARPRVHAWREG